jgi:hypothetical protein
VRNFDTKIYKEFRDPLHIPALSSLFETLKIKIEKTKREEITIMDVELSKNNSNIIKVSPLVCPLIITVQDVIGGACGSVVD